MRPGSTASAVIASWVLSRYWPLAQCSHRSALPVPTQAVQPLNRPNLALIDALRVHCNEVELDGASSCLNALKDDGSVEGSSVSNLEGGQEFVFRQTNTLAQCALFLHMECSIESHSRSLSCRFSSSRHLRCVAGPLLDSRDNNSLVSMMETRFSPTDESSLVLYHNILRETTNGLVKPSKTDTAANRLSSDSPCSSGLSYSENGLALLPHLSLLFFLIWFGPGFSYSQTHTSLRSLAVTNIIVGSLLPDLKTRRKFMRRLDKVIEKGNLFFLIAFG